MVAKVSGVAFKKDEIEPLINGGITFGELKNFLSSAIRARSNSNGLQLNPGSISNLIDRLDLKVLWNSKLSLREKRKLKIRDSKKEKRISDLENSDIELQRRRLLGQIEFESFNKMDAHPFAKKFVMQYWNKYSSRNHRGGARYSLDKLLMFFDWVWKYFDESGNLPTYTQAAEYGKRINLGRESFYPSSVGKIFFKVGLQTKFGRHFSRQVKDIKNEVLKFKESPFYITDIAHYLGISDYVVRRTFRTEGILRENLSLIFSDKDYTLLFSHASEIYLLLDEKFSKEDIVKYMKEKYNHPKEIIDYVIENRITGGLEEKIKLELGNVFSDTVIDTPYIKGNSSWII